MILAASTSLAPIAVMATLALLCNASCSRRDGQREEGGGRATASGAGMATGAEAPASQAPASTAEPRLLVSEISFAGPAGHRPDAAFGRGETVLCLFTVAGFTYKDRQADIRADIEVSGPGGETVLLQSDLELLRGEAPSQRPGTLRTAARLQLNPAAPAGRHTVRLTIRDLLAKRQGSGEGTFSLLGNPVGRSARFSIAALRLAADTELPPGEPAPLLLEARGFAARAEPGGGFLVDLAIEAKLLDASGKTVIEQSEPLLRRALPFHPQAYPLEYLVDIPAKAVAGPHRLAIKVSDRLGNGQSSGEVPVTVVAPGDGLRLVNAHLHDASGLTRARFLLGEQIFVRLAVHGFASRAGRASVSVDLALAGPDGGVYLTRKDGATVEGERSAAAVRAGRCPVQIPLLLPALAPTGRYRLALRAKDLLGRQTAVRELSIDVEGKAPRPLGTFRVEALEVHERPDLPPGAGDTFVAGKIYHLVLRLGGARFEVRRKVFHGAKIEASLRLRNLAGQVVHERKSLFRLHGELTYRPLRLLLPAEWEVPPHLAPGLYDLEVSALNLLDDRVSQLTRRVEIVRR